MKRVIVGAALASALSGCNSYCVARGTRVKTRRGEKNVEDVTVGDEIESLDVDTGQLIPVRVVAVRSARRECVLLKAGNVELTVTSDHPLYCPVKAEYAPAGDWVLGKRASLLVVGTEGPVTQTVQQVKAFVGIHEVFDLTVDHALHNFIANGVLVHNKSPLPPDCTFDGGVVRAFSPCVCADGRQGSVMCYEEASDTGLLTGTCENCRGDIIDGGVDGGDGG